MKVLALVLFGVILATATAQFGGYTNLYANNYNNQAYAAQVAANNVAYSQAYATPSYGYGLVGPSYGDVNYAQNSYAAQVAQSASSGNTIAYQQVLPSYGYALPYYGGGGYGPVTGLNGLSGINGLSGLGGVAIPVVAKN